MLRLLFLLTLLGLVALVVRLVTGERMTGRLKRRFGASHCRVSGHRRRSETVRKDGDVYYSRCRRCDVRLRKSGRDAPWEVAPPTIPTRERTDDGDGTGDGAPLRA